MLHRLKITPYNYSLLICRQKTYEIRKNDRFFKAGDEVILSECANGHMTGNLALAEIVSVFFDAEYCKEGFVILQLGNIRVGHGGETYDDIPGANYSFVVNGDISGDRWVKMSERQPCEEKEYLVVYQIKTDLSGNQKRTVLKYFPNLMKPRFQHADHLGLIITHWQELPELPEREEDMRGGNTKDY